jgi:hypothetical protein
MSDAITVGVVSWYSTSHIKRFFQSLSNTVAKSPLEFVICDNTNGQDHTLYKCLGDSCQIIPFSPTIPQVRQRKAAAGSYAHAAGLNMLLSKVTAPFALFADPDCVVLAKGWDVICKRLLSDRCIAVGTPHHSRKIPKYHDFPSPIFVCFQPERFRAIQADWTPYLLPLHVHLRDRFLRIPAILGGSIGEQLMGQAFHASAMAKWMRRFFGNTSKDTGWRIPGAARQNGYYGHLFTPAITIDQLHPSLRTNEAIITLMLEYELFLWQDLPAVVHFYGNKHRLQRDTIQASQRWADLLSVIDEISLLGNTH